MGSFQGLLIVSAGAKIKPIATTALNTQLRRGEGQAAGSRTGSFGCGARNGRRVASRGLRVGAALYRVFRVENADRRVRLAHSRNAEWTWARLGGRGRLSAPGSH